MADDKQQTSPEGADFNSQVAYLRELANIVAQEGLSELEIEGNGVKLSLKSAAPVVVSAESAPVVTASSVAPAARATKAPKKSNAKDNGDEGLIPIVSPMVGVFYRAPSPNDPNFVEIGDRVEKGQTIGLVEAMKVFNEITAEASGVVARIAVENNTLVETGQPLLLLKR